MIKAKFKCISISVNPGPDLAMHVNLQAVTADSEENKTFSKYTPYGNLDITITNPSAFGAFKPGAEYILDFTECPQVKA
jgi:hypothetical protein